ncbi:MAG: VCBS repeat-containing protein [Flavobacteriales bacterium]|nr:VCBS repeat-containing protein [Flavobacteriales bacterium]
MFLPATIAFSSAAQSFPSSYTPWPLPSGGLISDGTTCGFNTTNDLTSFGEAGSNRWALRDMDGDTRPDLLVLAVSGSLARHRTFNTGSGPHWRVHLNTGAGFSSTAINWSLPGGGVVMSNDTLGYIMPMHGGLVNYVAGSRTWGLEDLNGDGRPDLVVTGERLTDTSPYSGFNPGPGAHWKVYLNNGSGFNTSPVTWPVPPGGFQAGGVDYGFHHVVGIVQTNCDDGTYIWRLADMNNDGKPDLVVTGAHTLQGLSSFPSAFDVTINSFWKVFMNTGSSFLTTPYQQALPAGGNVRNGVLNGFFALYAFDPSADIASDCWAMRDLNGDGWQDLLVIGRKVTNMDYSSFFQGSDGYWKVHWGGLGGFDATPNQWWMPEGGMIRSSLHLGFNTTGHNGGAVYDMGSDTWTLADLDGDRFEDLLVMGERAFAGAPYTSDFSAAVPRYWKLHTAADTGFAQVYEPWLIPNGGVLDEGLAGGFASPLVTPSAVTDTGSEAFELIDLDGSGTPDLVVNSARAANGKHITFDQSTAPHWRVYMNPFFVGMPDHNTPQALLQLVPNPALEHVRGALSGGMVRELRIFDLHGRDLRMARGEVMDLAGVAAGVYLIVAIDTRGARHTARLVKQ